MGLHESCVSSKLLWFVKKSAPFCFFHSGFTITHKINKTNYFCYTCQMICSSHGCLICVKVEKISVFSFLYANVGGIAFYSLQYLGKYTLKYKTHLN